MSELGDRLRASRESQGISLAQAAAETRILQRYLVALEEGDYKYLPGDVYARGFIRNYALYLKIPVEELIQLYRYERGRTEPIVIRPAVVAPRIRGAMLPNFFGMFFVMLCIVGFIWLILRVTEFMNLGSPIESVSTEATPTIAGVAPTAMPEPTAAPAQPTAAPSNPGAATATPDAAAAATATPEAPIVMVIKVDAGKNPGSWLNVKIDNKSVFQKVLKPGESLRYTAQRNVWIRAGNAYVVTVDINGVEQRLSNTPGDVVSFSWPPP
jgi:cytoskeletal protein RodZ